ncbi:hypothetical protein [Sphingobacterium faecale]|uniref:Uncharacterized protein n=1 Tax=Sphingobacterium faecale TaxID=2803775 RepID=A0ABS1R0R5_9SPHI|nr:hypothetical protein [Sphingobacterium faecale]MBL1408271.1 hypothetical protein [Sphingobacterium faecale]
MEDLKSEDWNHERAILDISFENQVGAATIFRDEDFNGKVTFMYNEAQGHPNELKIRSLELSVGAKSTVGVNEVIHFNDSHEAILKVTSASGKEREWKLNYVAFKDDLVGTWEITTLSVYGGAWPEYGGAATINDMAARSWNWSGDNTGPIAEYDNTLTFTLEGITEEGDAYGKVFNDKGPDNKFGDFIFITDPDGSRTPIDVNSKYRKIPKGEGTWKRNAKQGTITFSSDDVVSTGRFVTSGTYQMDTYNNKIIIPDQAFEFEYQPSFIWLDIYNDRERFVENLKKYWIQVRKVNP